MAPAERKRSPPSRGRSPPHKRRASHGRSLQQKPRAPPSPGCSGSHSEEEERAERHYMVRVGDRFDDGRYVVKRQLGKGTFGRVVEMWDEKMRRTVAVKVVRAITKYRDEAKIEAEILREVQDRIPGGTTGEPRVPICRLFDTFVHRGHYCIALEKLGSSLYEALRSRRRRLQMTGAKEGVGQFFSLRRIQAIATDCFAAIAHLHWVGLTHTDLKLENVLFVESSPVPGDLPASSSVRLVDFGGATWRDEPTEGSIVCTRQYRPPEVTLGIGWGHPVDMWSMGCILTELWTGELLFQTHDEVEHLALMERLLGALPPHMLRAAASTSHRMDRNLRHGTLRWPERAYDRRSEAHVRSQRRLRDVLLGADGSPSTEREQLARSRELGLLYDLLLRVLEFDPSLRMSATEASAHPFFTTGHVPPPTPPPPTPPLAVPPQTNWSSEQ